MLGSKFNRLTEGPVRLFGFTLKFTLLNSKNWTANSILNPIKIFLAPDIPSLFDHVRPQVKLYSKIFLCPIAKRFQIKTHFLNLFFRKQVSLFVCVTLLGKYLHVYIFTYVFHTVINKIVVRNSDLEINKFHSIV